MGKKEIFKFSNGKTVEGYEYDIFIVAQNEFDYWQVFTKSGLVVIATLRTKRSTEMMIKEILPYAKLALNANGEVITIFDLNYRLFQKAVKHFKEKFYYA